jgi:carbamoyl-phosphate synthase small subunit
MKGIIYLEDGTTFLGKGFGKKGTAVGELVFNTSLTGYQEILTDPSYAGQVITLTYPLIGNYGVNHYDEESTKIHAKGLVVKSFEENPSNYLSEGSIEEMLIKMNTVGVCDVDTRSITRKIRSKGAVKCVISNEDLSLKELQAHLDSEELKDDWMKVSGTQEIIRMEGSGPKVAVIDFGIKSNILRNLQARDCDITVFPYSSTYEEIMASSPDGVFLSNGPGDPKAATEAIEIVKKIIKKKPTFGICMGHQVLALALGGDTYKMKFGHRGGNHGVYDITRDRAYITSQNHGYAVSKDSLDEDTVEITHINLNDDTVEGLRHKTLPVYSVQYHPEGSPGPKDSTYLFDQFISEIKGAK